MNEIVGVLRKTLVSKQSVSRASFKRDYKLTSKSNINIWFDCLKSELTTKELIDAIDDSVSITRVLTSDDMIKRKNIVRDIMISHLDKEYHKKVLDISDPKEILIKLREHERIEVNFTDSGVREQPYNLKLNKNDKVAAFLEKFDSVIGEYEICDTAIHLTEAEKRSAFLKATKELYPTIVEANLLRQQVSHSEMTLEELRKYRSQLEATRKTSNASSIWSTSDQSQLSSR